MARAPWAGPKVPGGRVRNEQSAAGPLRCRATPSRRHSKRKDNPVSHHLDTPLASQTGQLYLDDLYVFPGEDSTVFVMDVNSTITGAHAEPAFHPEARYEFKVHLDGAEFEDLTYRVSFGDADPAGRQTLQLHAISGPEAREDS